MADTIQKKTIAQELAVKMVQAAESKARQLGRAMCTAIVDDGGNLKAFSRMDGAPILSVQIAIDKAYTSIAFGFPTHSWFDFIKNDPPLLHGIVNFPRLIVFGGGYPIKVDEEVIGGIGVSGGHYTEDMQCAEAALALLPKR